MDAIGAGKSAAASLLGGTTGRTGGIRPEAIRWKDFRAPHEDGRKRRNIIRGRTTVGTLPA